MRRLRCAAALLAAAPVLTGCGIQETDVVQAGGPATIQVFPQSSTGMVLFFRSPDGELLPVIRSLEGEFEDPQSPGASTGETLSVLFAGPAERDRAAGLTTGLPELPPGATLRAAPSDRSGVEVTLPIALGRLDDTALRQLVCTTAFSEDPEGLTPVHLRGTDGPLEQANCDADIDLGVQPRPTARPS
ncbi:hypothetical protein [Streptomyces sp. NPDC002187]|uniref:hypothetical protein n=1 Tax=Streptomyces sp. NPDC002187 TaxID=3364637 RepID=UPI0036D08996